uniref:tRNA methyltransferase 10 homolog C n=1 Tax=Leptobrachium leishanense TaxID=445787 RepID=A0A8C5LTH2_9ANUR
MAYSIVPNVRIVNLLIRTLRCSSYHTVVQKGDTKWSWMNMPCQWSQYRTLKLSSFLGTDDTKLDLDEWKTIMKSSDQNTAVEPSTEDASLVEMRQLVEMWRLAGRAVPESISTEKLQALMDLTSVSSRKKYLRSLSIKEKFKINERRKKQEFQKARMEHLSQLEPREETEPKNTMFLKFWSSSLDILHRWRLVQAMQFGQPLVFDMVYERHMSPWEIKNTADQLMMSEGFNRKAADPFHIHFCSLNPDGPCYKELVKLYSGSWENVLLTATEESHVDVFPRDQLVYLTADSPNELKKFDHNKVYIIGSLVDRSQQTGLSLANAKRLNLATAKLPLDRYLKWDCGAKNLTLDQMICILLSLKEQGDWKKALSFVPTRKHEGFVERRQSQDRFPRKAERYGKHVQGQFQEKPLVEKYKNVFGKQS